MRKLLYLIGLVAVAALVATGAALAGNDDGDSVGTAGQPNCAGQTTGALANTGTDLGSPGLAGFAQIAGLTVDQVKGGISDYCDSASFLGAPPQRRDFAPRPQEPNGGGGGSPPSCEDATQQASVLNLIGDVEQMAANASSNASEYLAHQNNANVLHATAQAIVAASCPPPIQ